MVVKEQLFFSAELCVFLSDLCVDLIFHAEIAEFLAEAAEMTTTIPISRDASYPVQKRECERACQVERSRRQKPQGRITTMAEILALTIVPSRDYDAKFQGRIASIAGTRV